MNRTQATRQLEPTVATYSFDNQQRFVVDNYNWSKAFSNFLPGIAGKWGIPSWCYYVNRHQAVCSLGVEDKNHQILEFRSFNRALAAVGREGFRTFLRWENGEVYEPFRKGADSGRTQRMMVSPGELELWETNPEVGVETDVLYFSLVNDRVPALVRRLTLKNISRQALELELADGVAHILPYGIDHAIMQSIPRHIEGMMKVAEYRGVPLFRLKQTPGDIERVEELEGGNFFFSRWADQAGLPVDGLVVDPAALFGEPEVHEVPWPFRSGGLAAVRALTQIRQNRTPCAFTTARLSLEPGQEKVLYSFIGFAGSDAELDGLLERTAGADFVESKRDQNAALLTSIRHQCLTLTASSEFNAYCEQNFLDNVIRGGMPLVFETGEGKSAFYLYSRQNGDLERDYHHFVVEATYLSQGTGHYRSVLQNRRCDTWFCPEVDDFNIRLFMSLTQLDSYSPLEVLGTTYTVRDRAGARAWLKRLVADAGVEEALWRTVTGSFTPGRFVMQLEELGVCPKRDYLSILNELLAYCGPNEVGDRLHLGFWIDHWSYNLDTIEVYLMVYPDRLRELLLENRAYTFFDNPDRVRPRSETCVFDRGRVRQYDAVVYDEDKHAFIQRRKAHPYRVRTEYGEGEIYRTHLCAKMLSHVANRVATLDAGNTGVEMEANKPGWNDSMSALAGIFGSELGQTFELERAARFLRSGLRRLLPDAGSEISLYEELAGFMRRLTEALDKRLGSDAADKDWVYWDESHRVKEAYRARTRLGVSGREVQVPVSEIVGFLDRVMALVGELYQDDHRAKAFDANGIPFTYLHHDVRDYEPLAPTDAGANEALSHQGFPLVRARSFEARPLALFLEGPVHYLRAHPERAAEIYPAIKRSGLYDRKLAMYKVCASLAEEPYEIGRVHAWGPGWIENESIYTHMEYKYLLELLKSGLDEQFFEDIQTGLVCFLDPGVYGRSTVENVSFLVSSAFPDASMHGQGLQPRLSGVTSEMAHIWILMMAGPQPFYLDEREELGLKLEPRLPEWLFTREEQEIAYDDGQGSMVRAQLPADAVAFKFLGRTLVVYHNPGRKNTYGPHAARPASYRLVYRDGRAEDLPGATVGQRYALQVRGGEVARMDVALG